LGESEEIGQRCEDSLGGGFAEILAYENKKRVAYGELLGDFKF